MEKDKSAVTKELTKLNVLKNFAQVDAIKLTKKQRAESGA